jgi:hypothetical protein
MEDKAEIPQALANLSHILGTSSKPTPTDPAPVSVIGIGAKKDDDIMSPPALLPLKAITSHLLPRFHKN